MKLLEGAAIEERKSTNYSGHHGRLGIMLLAAGDFYILVQVV